MKSLFKSLLLAFLFFYTPSSALSLIDIKGIMLQRISSFITWPQLPDENIKVCIVGNEEFAEHLQNLYKNKKLHGRKLDVVSSDTDVEEELLRSCHIIYIADNDKNILQKIARTLNDNATLIIGSDSENIYDGASVVLYLDGSRYKIMINKTRLEATQLKADYRLLKLAKIVENGGKF